MKKLSFILGLLSILAFSSCSKEKECKCIYSSNGTTIQETTMTITSGKCSNMNQNHSGSGVTVSITCTEL